MKRDDKGNPNKAADHVRLYSWLMESAAWKDLTTDERSLYVLLKERYKGINNGRIILSTRQVSDALHISKTTAAKAFRGLIRRGFIEVVIKGTFGGRKDGRATEWRLTEHKCDVSGELASKAFMRWRPGSISAVRTEVQTVRPEGQAVLERAPSESLSA